MTITLIAACTSLSARAGSSQPGTRPSPPASGADSNSEDNWRELLQRGVALANRGEFAKAEVVLKDALGIAQRIHQSDHLDLAVSLNALAYVRNALGRYTDAEPLFEQSLAMLQRLFPGDHTLLPTAFDNLASVRRALGRFAEAEPLYEQALAMRQRIHKGDHPDVAMSLNNLASVREALGRPADSEPLFEQSLAMLRRLFPGDHPVVAISLNNLAMVRQEHGRSADAEPLLEQALAMLQNLLPGDDPNVAVTLNNLALVRQKLGRPADAEPLYERALAMWRRLRPDDDPDVALSLSHLGSVRRDLGRTAEAEPLCEQALAMYRRLFPGNHPDVAMSLGNLAWIRKALGRVAEAEPLFEQALAMYQELHLGNHPELAQCLNDLAMVRLNLGRPADAAPLCEQALAIRRRLFPGNHPDVAISLNNLALVRQALGQAVDAEELLQQALAMTRALYPGNHPEVAVSLSNLAAARYLLGRTADAEQIASQALEMSRAVFPGDHPQVAKCLINLAVLRQALGQAPEAAQLFEQAQAMSIRLTVLPKIAGIDRVRWMSVFAAVSRDLQRLALTPNGAALAATSLHGSLWHKGVQTEAARAERAAMLVVADGDAQVRSMLDEQTRLIAEQSTLSDPLRGRPISEGELRRMTAIGERLAAVDRLLRDASPAYAERARLAEISVADVAASLGPSAALVEYSVIRPLIANPDRSSQVKLVEGPNEHYIAFVLRQDGSREGFAVHAVDLGDRSVIDRAVASFREKLNEQIIAGSGVVPSVAQLRRREQQLAELAGALRTLVWDRLAEHLAGTTRAYISPDERLHEVPFECLPTGQGPDGAWRYLVESTELVYVAGGRELARARLSTPVEPSAAAVLLGDPLFTADRPARDRALAALHASPAAPTAAGQQPADAAKTDSPLRGPELAARIAGTLGGGVATCSSDLQWAPLPETGEFLHRIGALLARSMSVAPPLTGAGASERGLLAALARTPRPRVLQLATHGFYCSAAPEEPAAAAPPRGELMREGSRQPVTDPMVRSMLILAGASSDQKDSDDNGLLSAAEVMALDLRGTELVSLTACHTGQGDVQPGEGVAGLRRAFTVAGAKSVLQSLWEVPATETLRQTTRFYDAWLVEGKPRYAAFRAAQLDALAHARSQSGFGHPWLWAGFTFAGDPGDLPAGR